MCNNVCATVYVQVLLQPREMLLLKKKDDLSSSSPSLGSPAVESQAGGADAYSPGAPDRAVVRSPCAPGPVVPDGFVVGHPCTLSPIAKEGIIVNEGALKGCAEKRSNPIR